MRSQALHRVFLLTASCMLFLGIAYAQAQQFPIGTYWVKNTDEGEATTYYSQVDSCEINLIVGGNKESNTNLLSGILTAAKNNGITLIIDRVNSANRLQRYGGSGYDDDTWGAYRKPYDSDGFNSTPGTRLPTIEAPILYDFSHPAGTWINEGGKRVWYAQPSHGSGYLLTGYTSPNSWQHEGKSYYVIFRMKVNDNSGDDLVATVSVVQNGINLVNKQIYANNFTSTTDYTEFKYYFTTNSSKAGAVTTMSAADSAYLELIHSLPEGGASSRTTLEQPVVCYLDYRVYYHRKRTLYVDQAIIQNYDGNYLFMGKADNAIKNDVTNAIGLQDPNNPTIRGFYSDEPYITRIAPIAYVNDLIGPIVPRKFGFPETMSSTIKNLSVAHQYLNAGQPANRDSKLLVDPYPIGYGSPTPGQSGYNEYIQGRWANYLIPYLSDAAYVSSYNSKPFWHAVQVHSWEDRYRDPDPKEIRCMVNLGLAYGAKGIFYFLYASIDSVSAIGLVDESFNHNAEPYNSKWNEVQQINKNLQLLAPDLLNLNWQSAFTNGDAVPSGSVVQSVTGSDSIEIANFTHNTTGEKYFMLVNRRCETADIKTLTVTLQSNSNWRLIQDVLASRTEWDNEQYRVPYRALSPQQPSFTVKLNPGEGRLFRIITSLSTVSGTISSNTTWSGNYIVTGDITVSNNATLTISQGALVFFSGYYQMSINNGSKVIANGSSTNPILFTGAALGSWKYLCPLGGNNSLNWCIFQFATYPLYIYNATSGTPTSVENCVFRNNSNYGIRIYGSKANVKNCEIKNNGYYGIHCQYDPEVKFTGNRIYHNSMHGVYTLSSNLLKFYGNVIEYNGVGNTSHRGIYTANSDVIKLGEPYSAFYGKNTIRYNGGTEVYAASGGPNVVANLCSIHDVSGLEIENASGNPTIFTQQCYWDANGCQYSGNVTLNNPIQGLPSWDGQTFSDYSIPKAPAPGGEQPLDDESRIKELKELILNKPETVEAEFALFELYSIIRADYVENKLEEKDTFYKFLADVYVRDKTSNLGKTALKFMIVWKRLDQDFAKFVQLSNDGLKELDGPDRMYVLVDLGFAYAHAGKLDHASRCLADLQKEYSEEKELIRLLEEDISDVKWQI